MLLPSLDRQSLSSGQRKRFTTNGTKPNSRDGTWQISFELPAKTIRLKDHNIPFPEPSDRKALYDTVEEHWNKITPPYEQWSESQLRDWLLESGSQAVDIASSKKDDLIALVQQNYEESSDSLVAWVLDSWTDSQLKSFLDYHNIPNPTPRNRDSMLQTARGAYSNIASIGPSAYDTLFGSWQDSDIKAWLDARGVPVPQGSTKESMLASLRRNTHSFTEQAKAKFNDLTSQSVGDKIFDSWSDSQLKELLDSNGIPIPQGSKTNEMRALARKNYKSLKNSASEYYASGASYVSNSGASAATQAIKSGASLYGEAKKSADSAASVASKSAESAASVGRKSAESAASVASKSAKSAASDASKYGKGYGEKAKKSAESAASVASRSAESLASEASKAGKDFGAQAKTSAGSAASVASKSAESLASEASKTGKSYAGEVTKSAGSLYNEASKSAASAYGKASDAAGDAATDLLGSNNILYTSWSDSRLKSFLDARGVPVPQNGKKDDLVALVRENSHKARLSAEDFEGWSSEQLNKFVKESKIKLNNAASKSREELIKQTKLGYDELLKKGDAASVEVKKQYENVKGYTFDSWSDSDLKAYLDSYGVEVPQNGVKDQLVAAARKHGHYFSHGQTGPVAGSGLIQIASDGLTSLLDFIKQASGVGYNKAAKKADEVTERVKAEL